MLTRIKRSCALPQLPADIETARRARLLNAMIWIALVYLVFILPFSMLYPRTPPVAILTIIVTFFLLLPLYGLLRRGSVRLASAGLVGLLFASQAIVLFSLGTIRTPVTGTLLAGVILAGVLFDWTGTLITIVAGAMIAGGVITAANRGLLNPPDDSQGFMQWLVFTCLIGISGALSLYAGASIRGALQRAQQEIAERARVETELRTLTRAVEQSPASIVITDLKGTIEYVNPRFTQVTGYSREEAVGQNPRILKSEQTRPETYGEMWAALGAGKEWSGEFVNRKKDGSLYTERATMSPITGPDGAVTHYLAVKEDITERKRNEQLLQAAVEQLRRDMVQIEALQQELREQSLRDPLTGLHNRRYLAETLPREAARSQREGSLLSIVIADVDYFKQINDTYGHQAGDRFLMALAGLMKSNARGSDIVCRYGGEEFLLALPGASLEAAARRAEDLRLKCAQLVIQEAGRELSASLSCGVASYPAHGQTAEEVIIKADRALYRSKAAGRDRVTVWEEGG